MIKKLKSEFFNMINKFEPKHLIIISVLLSVLFLSVILILFGCQGENTPPEEHTHIAGEAVRTDEKAPTCAAEGSYALVVYCVECDIELSRTSYAIPIVNHKYNDPIRENEVEATCANDGSYDCVVYCAFCDYEFSRTSEIIPKVDHTPAEAVEEVKVAPKCKTSGVSISVVKCTWCDTELSREEKHIPPSRHSWSNYKCIICGVEYSVAESLDLALSEDGTYYIVVGYGTCLEVDLVIPSYYNGLPIKEIANYAFYNCYLIESAYIPSTITRIGYGAAWGCTSLKKLLIEDRNGWYLMEGYDDTDGIAIPAIFLFDTSIYLEKLTGGDYFWLTKNEGK